MVLSQQLTWVPHPPSTPPSQEETFEESEVLVNEEVTLETPILSLPVEVLMPPPPFIADDFRQFQNLIRRVADALWIPLEEVRDQQHMLLDIL